MNIDEIRNRLLSHFPDTYDKSEGTVLWDISQAYALEMSEQYDKVEQQKTEYFLVNITDETILDAKLADYGRERKNAVKAEGSITIKGIPGTYVPKGTHVASEIVEYETLNSMFIGENGEIDIPILCTIAGKIGNATIGVINSFPLTITGCYECFNKFNITNGADRESVEEVKKRVLNELAEPSTSGNIFDYKKWAKEVDGVGNARVIPRWNGVNTVKILIVDRSNNEATESLIIETHTHVETKRPVGVNVTVESATVKHIDVSFEQLKIDQNSNQTTEQTILNIKTNLMTYINGVGLDEQAISYALSNDAVKKSSGVLDFLNLKLNSVIGGVDLAVNEIAKFRKLTIDGVEK